MNEPLCDIAHQPFRLMDDFMPALFRVPAMMGSHFFEDVACDDCGAVIGTTFSAGCLRAAQATVAIEPDGTYTVSMIRRDTDGMIEARANHHELSLAELPEALDWTHAYVTGRPVDELLAGSARDEGASEMGEAT